MFPKTQDDFQVSFYNNSSYFISISYQTNKFSQTTAVSKFCLSMNFYSIRVCCRTICCFYPLANITLTIFFTGYLADVFYTGVKKNTLDLTFKPKVMEIPALAHVLLFTNFVKKTLCVLRTPRSNFRKITLFLR